MSDEASVNYKTIKNVKNAGGLSVSATLHCFSHGLSNTGERLFDETVHEFLTHWNAFVSHSSFAQRLYFHVVRRSCPRITNSVRWYVQWEECRDLYRDRERLIPFLEAYIEGRAAPSARRCREMLTTNSYQIYFPLSVITERGRFLCKACYFLEGDGFLFPWAASKLEQCLAAIDPDSALSPQEEKWCKNFARTTSSNEAVAIRFWTGIRNSILRPAYEWLRAMLPEEEPDRTKNHVKSRARSVAKYTFLSDFDNSS